MRLKILVLGDDPISLVADCQLLRERGLMVFTAFNMQNVNELVSEIRPDVVLFDIHKQTPDTTSAYNEFVNGIEHTHIPVIYTLSEDDVYLITRKRTAAKEKRTLIADNLRDAVKMALTNNKTYQPKFPRASNYPAKVIHLPTFPARA